MAEFLINLLLSFFAFSFIGWCIEVILKYRQFHKFINRGFLSGPWLPIYGFGAVLLTLSVFGIGGFESSIGTTFIISFIVCGFVEYMASYILEKRYHARWWDYSKKPMNLHGRVWIGNLVLFGLGGIAIIEIANPFFYDVFSRMNILYRSILAGVLSVAFIIDFIGSQFIMKLVKFGIEHSDADNTEAISKEVDTEESLSKRKETKELIKKLKETNPNVEMNIFNSMHNVNLSTVLAYKKDGVVHPFTEFY